jgi:hypothetical protein
MIQSKKKFHYKKVKTANKKLKQATIVPSLPVANIAGPYN